MSGHVCVLDSPFDESGEAISTVYGDDEGRLWATNTEYTQQVNYCPVCGQRAQTQVDPDWFEKSKQ